MSVHIFQNDIFASAHNDRQTTKTVRVYVRADDLFVYVFDGGEVVSAESYPFEFLDGEWLHGEEWTVETRSDAIEYLNENHNYVVDTSTTVV